ELRERTVDAALDQRVETCFRGHDGEQELAEVLTVGALQLGIRPVLLEQDAGVLMCQRPLIERLHKKLPRTAARDTWPRAGHVSPRGAAAAAPSRSPRARLRRPCCRDCHPRARWPARECRP